MVKQKKPWDSQRQADLAAVMRERYPSTSDSQIAGNEGKRQVSSGIIGDLFNVLGRPSRAVAGGVYGAIDNNPNTTVGGEVASALTGHGQHNFSDVLGALGVKNRVAKAVGGFGLDVALDPLTYVGIKGEQGMSATEALSNAAKQVAENDPNQLLGDTVHRLASQIQSENPAHLYVEFAGKRVGPGFVTPSKVYNTVKDSILGPDLERRTVAKLFSRDAELGSDLAQRARVFEGQSAGEFERVGRALNNINGRLNYDDQKLISHAMQTGQDLSSVPVAEGTKPVEGMNFLGDYVKLNRELLNRWFNDEVAMGLRKEGEHVDNYVPTYFRGKIPEQFPDLPLNAQVRFSKRLGSVATDLSKLTLEDIERGYPEAQPMRDIDSIMQQRAASHFRQIGRQQLRRDALESFGVKAGELTDEQKASLQKLGFVDAKHIAGPGLEDYVAQGYHLPQQMVKVLNQTERVLTDNNTANNFMRWYDKVTHKWKFLNTTVNPGYWTRNSMSDAVMNFMDGVRNPKHYDQAFRVLQEHRGAATDDLLGLIGKGGNPAVESSIDFAGTRVPSSQVWTDFLRSGGKTGDITTNLSAPLDPAAREGLGNFLGKSLQTGASGLKKVGAAETNLESKLMDWNNMREDFWRLGHFISAVDDGVKSGMPYEDAVMKAGQRVRKYNIDYGALSTFERKYVRRVIPFYSWMRRNTPLQMELLLTRPGFMAAYSKGNDLMQGLLGTEDGSGDYMVPKWIRDSMPVRVAMANNKSSDPISKFLRSVAGAKSDEGVFMPAISSMTPLGDLQHITQPIQAFTENGGLSSPGRATVAGVRQVASDVVNMSTPAIKMPVEAAMGRSAFTGAPIDDWKGYLLEQLGPGRTIAGVTQGNTHGLVSQLTGIQLQPVTAARQKGEFRRRQDVIQGRIKATDSRTRAAQYKRYLSQSGRSVGA